MDKRTNRRRKLRIQKSTCCLRRLHSSPLLPSSGMAAAVALLVLTHPPIAVICSANDLSANISARRFHVASLTGLRGGSQDAIGPSHPRPPSRPSPPPPRFERRDVRDVNRPPKNLVRPPPPLPPPPRKTQSVTDGGVSKPILRDSVRPPPPPPPPNPPLNTMYKQSSMLKHDALPPPAPPPLKMPHPQSDKQLSEQSSNSDKQQMEHLTAVKDASSPRNQNDSSPPVLKPPFAAKALSREKSWSPRRSAAPVLQQNNVLLSPPLQTLPKSRSTTHTRIPSSVSESITRQLLLQPLSLDLLVAFAEEEWALPRTFPVRFPVPRPIPGLEERLVQQTALPILVYVPWDWHSANLSSIMQILEYQDMPLWIPISHSSSQTMIPQTSTALAQQKHTMTSEQVTLVQFLVASLANLLQSTKETLEKSVIETRSKEKEQLRPPLPWVEHLRSSELDNIFVPSATAVVALAQQFDRSTADPLLSVATMVLWTRYRKLPDSTFGTKEFVQSVMQDKKRRVPEKQIRLQKRRVVRTRQIPRQTVLSSISNIETDLDNDEVFDALLRDMALPMHFTEEYSDYEDYEYEYYADAFDCNEDEIDRIKQTRETPEDADAESQHRRELHFLDLDLTRTSALERSLVEKAVPWVEHGNAYEDDFLTAEDLEILRQAETDIVFDDDLSEFDSILSTDEEYDESGFQNDKSSLSMFRDEPSEENVTFPEEDSREDGLFRSIRWFLRAESDPVRSRKSDQAFASHSSSSLAASIEAKTAHQSSNEPSFETKIAPISDSLDSGCASESKPKPDLELIRVSRVPFYRKVMNFWDWSISKPRAAETENPTAGNEGDFVSLDSEIFPESALVSMDEDDLSSLPGSFDSREEKNQIKNALALARTDTRGQKPDAPSNPGNPVGWTEKLLTLWKQSSFCQWWQSKETEKKVVATASDEKRKVSPEDNISNNLYERTDEFDDMDLGDSAVAFELPPPPPPPHRPADYHHFSSIGYYK